MGCWGAEGSEPAELASCLRSLRSIVGAVPQRRRLQEVGRGSRPVGKSEAPKPECSLESTTSILATSSLYPQDVHVYAAAYDPE